MPREYKHTQTGYFILFVALSFIILHLLTDLISLPVMMIGISLVLPFSTMTVTVASSVIQIRIGIGLLGRKIALSEVVSCQKVRTLQIYGLGVRYIRGGKLYRIGGMSSVELRLKNGSRVVIGTDDSDALANVINELIKNTSE